jgi:outer membrane protein OmpA-like peptidoglycan-associated protein
MFTSSTYSEYSPVIYDRDFLIFTSDRPEATGNQNYSWTGSKFSDLFIMPKNGSEVRKFDEIVNTPQNEGTACFAKDFNTIYFTRCHRDNAGDDFCKIMFSKNIQGVWAEAEDLPFTKDRVQYGHPALIENDSILVFTSDLSDPGGKFDLYYSVFEDGSWSAPEAMPRTINTDGNEKFPTSDGDTLYFSSDFLPGMGGYDIFKTWLRSDRTWSPPQNLRYPVNSGKDDFGYVVDRTEKLSSDALEVGFFSSNRNGEGKDDLYRYVKRKTDQQLPAIAGKSNKQVSRRIFLSGRVRQKVYTEGNPDLSLLGTPPLSDAYVALNSGSQRIQEWKTKQDGIYVAEITFGEKYILSASASGFLTASITIDSPELDLTDTSDTKTVYQDIILDKIYYDKEIRLSNVYYEFDRWELTPNARLVVDTLAEMLRINPAIQLVLSAHTDCRGDDDYNLTLSQKRAQSVVDYLITKGIAKSRLEAMGFGETQPAEPCLCVSCTDVQHESNRRTTFMIKSVKK